MSEKWLKNPPQPPLIIYAQATYYPEMVQVYIPNSPMFRLPLTDPKMLNRFDPPKLEDDIDADPIETDIDRAHRRAKKRISDYALSNDFDLFATFTFALNRGDVIVKRKQFLTWLKNQRTRNGRFKYLAVQEYHKDGLSVHFHALIGGYTGKLVPAINPKTGKPLIQKGKTVYNLASYTLGFTNAKLLGKDFDDRSKVARYIKKYISKDLHVEKGQHRYLASKNLSLPVIEDNPQKWYEYVEPDWMIETKNGIMMRFNHGKSPLSDLYLEAYRQ